MFSYNKVKLIKNQSPPEKLLGLFLFKSFVIKLYLIKPLLLSPGLNDDPKNLVQLSRKHKLNLIIQTWSSPNFIECQFSL